MKLSTCVPAALLLVIFSSFLFNTVSGQTSLGLLKGKVVDRDGRPIAGASISLTKLGSGFASITQSVADGSYRFASLEPGLYSVLVVREGFAATDVPEVAIEAGVNEPIDFELIIPVAPEIFVGRTLARMDKDSNLAYGSPYNSSLLVTVTDSKGDGVANASVLVQCPSANLKRKTSTDRTGRVIVGSLPPGNYSVRVSRFGFDSYRIPNVAVAGGQRSLNAELAPGEVSVWSITAFLTRRVVNVFQ